LLPRTEGVQSDVGYRDWPLAAQFLTFISVEGVENLRRRNINVADGIVSVVVRRLLVGNEIIVCQAYTW
jgi:hypothetical protein